MYLQVQNLSKYFDAFKAVHEISFELKKGEILGILGPNGAGKTTTLQMLLGLLTPTSGTIYYFDKNFKDHKEEILSQISFASAYLKLPGSSTIYENLDIFGRLYGLGSTQRKTAIEQQLRFFGMWEKRHQKMFGLSAGQITRVMLAKAFLHQPKIVLLDEPTASLDPDIALEVRQFIKEQQRSYGTSIILTSHNMDEVEAVCDRVLVFKEGRMIASETPKALAESISLSHLELVFTDYIEAAQAFFEQKDFSYTQSGLKFAIKIHEKSIANLLLELSKKEIHFAQISIDKPSLEDYFLQISKPDF